MLSRSATILSLSWKAQSRRHLATSASCVASFSSCDMASYCFLSTSISLLARSMSSVAESCFCEYVEGKKVFATHPRAEVANLLEPESCFLGTESYERQPVCYSPLY